MNSLDFLTAEILAESYNQSLPEKVHEVYHNQDQLIGLVVEPDKPTFRTFENHISTGNIIVSHNHPLITIRHDKYCWIDGYSVGHTLKDKSILRRLIGLINPEITKDDIFLYDFVIEGLKKDSERNIGSFKYYHYQSIDKDMVLRPLYIPSEERKAKMIPFMIPPPGF